MFDAINTIIILIALVSLFITTFIYFKNPKDKVVSAFLLLIFNSTAWTLSMFLYRAAYYKNELFFFSNILYFTALLLPLSFLNLVRKLGPEHKERINRIFYSFLFLTSLYSLFSFGFFEKFNLISEVFRDLDNSEPVIIFNKLAFLSYSFLIMAPFSIGFWHIYHLYLNAKKEKKRILYFFIGVGILIPASISMLSNLILPYFQIVSLNWLGQLSAVVAPLVVLYGIYKYKIFNFELFVAEILIVILEIQALIYLLQSESIFSLIASLLSAMLIFIIGSWLLKNIKKEHKINKKLEQKILELEKLNTHVKDLNRKKSEFLSIATHQLRAPLTVVKGQLSMLLEGSYGQMNDKMQDAVKKIYDSVDRMSITVSDFLNVSRIEQGRMRYNFKNIKLNELLSSIYEELQDLAKKKGLEFTLDICPELKNTETQVFADYDKLRHVIFNITENAIKYTKSGFVKISYCSRAGKYAHIEIKDSGVGISKDEIKDLFSKFVRAKNVYGVNVIGSGLGLYIAREIMHAHNGRIWAKSKGLGKGASFFVELPFAQSKENEEKNQNAAKQS